MSLHPVSISHGFVLRFFLPDLLLLSVSRDNGQGQQDAVGNPEKIPVGAGQRKHQAKEHDNGNPPDHAHLDHERPLSGTVCILNTEIGPYYATRKTAYAPDDAANCTWMHILIPFFLQPYVL